MIKYIALLASFHLWGGCSFGYSSESNVNAPAQVAPIQDAPAQEVAAKKDSADQNTGATLYWKSGDRLEGSPLQAGPSKLTWQSNLFRDPLQLSLPALESVQWKRPIGEPLARTGYLVTTRDDQQLIGTILSMDQQTLRMRGTSFEEIALDRNQLASITRLDATPDRVLGPQWIEDWKGERDSKLAWAASRAGELICSESTSPIYRKLTLPNKSGIELEFRWSSGFDMQLGFAVPKKWGALQDLKGVAGQQQTAQKENKAEDVILTSDDEDEIASAPRLEMFGDSLVFQQQDNFEVVLENVELEARRLRLFMLLDQDSKQLQVFSEKGELLLTCSLSELPSGFEPGLFLVGKATGLRLKHLSILSAAEKFVGNSPYVYSKTKDVFEGNVESFDGKYWSVRQARTDTQPGEEAIQQIEASNFLSTVFAPLVGVQASPSQQAIASADLADGLRVSGKLMDWVGDKLRLQTSFSSEPIALNLRTALRVQFHSTSSEGVQQEGRHELVCDQGLLHGELKPMKDPHGPLHWLAAGSSESVALTGPDYKVRLRNKQPTAGGLVTRPYPDFVYFHNGDRVAAKVLGLESGELAIEAFERPMVFPFTTVLGCKFGAAKELLDAPLTGPEWQTEQRQAEVSDMSTLTGTRKEPRRTLFHRSLFANGEVAFAVAYKGKRKAESVYPTLDVHFLTDDPRGSKQRIALAVSPDPGSVTFLNPDESAHDSSVWVPVNLDSPIRCHLKVHDSELIASINNTEVYRRLIKLPKNQVQGVAFDASVQFELLNAQQAIAPELGHALLQKEVRKAAMTFPRFLSGVPAQSILCGQNADILRGNVVAMNDQAVNVRVGGRNAVVDRRYITSIIWPELKELAINSLPQVDGTQKGGSDSAQKIVGTSSESDSSASVLQLLSDDGSKLTLNLRSWSGEFAVGQSQQLGDCSVPRNGVFEIRAGRYARDSADSDKNFWRATLAEDIEWPKEKPASEPAAEEKLVGTSAPLFVLPGLNGTEVNLEQYRGRVVVLDFWATWCGYCVQELPEMIKQINALPSDKIQLVTINQGEDRATVEAFQKKNGLDFIVGFDKEEVSDKYKVSGLPTTFVIDATGKIAHVKVGGGEGAIEEMMKVVNKLIGEPIPNEPAMAQESKTEPVSETKPPADTKGAPVKVEAFVQRPRGNQPAMLVIRAEIAQGHKIFSMTQKAGGPVQTKVKLDPSELYSVGDFLAVEKLKSYPDPAFNNLEVEVHQGVVHWYAPLTLAQAEALENLEIKGKLTAQACNENNCFAPRGYPFVAKVSDRTLPDSKEEVPK